MHREWRAGTRATFWIDCLLGVPFPSMLPGLLHRCRSFIYLTGGRRGIVCEYSYLTGTALRFETTRKWMSGQQ